MRVFSRLSIVVGGGGVFVAVVVVVFVVVVVGGGGGCGVAAGKLDVKDSSAVRTID